MKLDNWTIDLAPLLGYMNAHGCLEISFSDLKIGDGDPDLPMDFDILRFTAGLPGFVEVEFWIRNNKVQHLQIRQAQMTFKELEDNGDLLPNLNVPISKLSTAQQTLAQNLVDRFLREDRSIVKEEMQRTVVAMAEKVMFNPPWATSNQVNSLPC